MLQPHSKQSNFIRSPKRFKVGRAGRKGGKTAMEVEIISYKATISAKKLNLSKTTFPTGRKIIYIAPTQTQARDIVWASFKNRLQGLAKFNEQRLEIEIPNEDETKTTIMIGGWENRENYRGLADVIHITFDEIDTLKNFFLSWQDIFRPMFLDTGGTADFIGTPKKENPNLKRLEKLAEEDDSYDCFHFTSFDNPFISRGELEALKKEYKDNPESYRQEVLAEHIENAGALFKYSALVDVFSNTITKTKDRFLIIDVSEDGEDKWVFSFWEGLEEYKREEFAHLSSNDGRNKIREYASQEHIPFSHILVDAIGVGSNLPSEPLLEGIVGFKSSYAAIKTDLNPVLLPNVNYTKTAPLISDYKNLRSQCVFMLADNVNNHKISSKITGQFKENTIEELSVYQDVSPGDGKRMATKKEDVKKVIGRSPDHSDTWIMRMYFVIMEKMLPQTSEQMIIVRETQQNNFLRNRHNNSVSSTK